jgi:hypothetical protein
VDRDVESDNQRQPKRLRTVVDLLAAQKAKKDDKGATENEEFTAATAGIGIALQTRFVIQPEHESAEPPLSVLSIPAIGDTKAQIHSKLASLAEVIVSGKSIALATGYAATTDSGDDAVTGAINQMLPWERELWEHFRSGSYPLPEIDWTKDQEPAPTSPKPLKIASRRAEALNRLYKTDKANETHVAWLTKHRIEHLPLVKLMARVIGAEINLTGGNGRWSAIQFADLQSINRILSLSSTIIAADGPSKGLANITTAQQVLGRRRHELRALTGKKGGI